MQLPLGRGIRDEGGVHGLSGPAYNLVPHCADCHGAHQIRPKTDPSSSIYPTNIPATCGACHGNTKGMEALGVRQSNPLENFLKSDHWKSMEGGATLKAATCADCHGAHKILAATDPKSPVYKTNVPSTCGKCHKGVEDQYSRSVHGKSLAEGPHGGTLLCRLPRRARHREEEPKDEQGVRGQPGHGDLWECHSSVRMAKRFNLPTGMVKSYQASFHGLASKYGDTAVANCASCHGSHDILPSSDPQSSINPKNLQATCGKCHPGAGETFAQTSIHLKVSASESPVLFWIQRFYILIIVLTLGGMALHNILDYVRHFKEAMKKFRPVAVYQRMNRSERVQHFLLLTSFLTLVATGFALKWPDSAWALPFLYFPRGFEARGWIHRGAAVVMVADSLFHVYYLLATKRGRGFMQDMMPTLQDVRMVEQMGYYLGYRARGARFRGSATPRKRSTSRSSGVPSSWSARASCSGSRPSSPRICRTGVDTAPKWSTSTRPCWRSAPSSSGTFTRCSATRRRRRTTPTWITGGMTRNEMGHYHPRELEQLDRKDASADKG